MDIVYNAITSVWVMLGEMSPYLLLGFFIAGLMHAFIPGTLFARYLSAKSWRSVVNAALLGIPLPLCSCGVIPTAMSLRREGASKGATVSFLIATPQTGVDSILATYSLMGLPFAVLRPLVALVTAMVGGCVTNIADNDGASTAAVQPAERQEANHGGFFGRLREALHYAYIDMMEDIGKWLGVGIVVAGIIALVPDECFTVFRGNTVASILLVMVLSVPMYLCATGSIPIAVALMLKGLTPGAALVMLMGGPACSMASIMVIGKVLGRRTLAAYLTSIVGGAVCFALVVDWALPPEWFVPRIAPTGECCHHPTAWWSVAGNILLLALLLRAWFFHGDHNHQHCEACTPSMTLHVEGMRCHHCAANVQKAVEAVEGVERVEVSLASSTVTVEGNASVEVVRKAIEALGFKVQE